MQGTVTITGKTGPGFTVTSQIINNVSNVNFDVSKGTVSITGGTPSNTEVFDINATTTTTVILVAGVSVAFVIAQ